MILASLLVLAMLGPGCTGGEARPPIVLIVVDTLRADHLSLHGYERDTAPQLVRWSERAAVFERAYSTSPWTLPSVASIFTGLSPSRHGAGYIVPAGGDERHSIATEVRVLGMEIAYARMDAEAATLAQLLATRGYTTGAVINNPFLSRNFGVATGFRDYDHEDGSDANTRRADEIVDRALAWIDERLYEPFFLVVHFFDPHMNYNAPHPHGGRFTENSLGLGLPVDQSRKIDEMAASFSRGQRQFIIGAYDEEVAFTDQEVGRFLDELKDRGILDRGVVAFTADHGEELFERDGFGHGRKFYEEQIHVPLLFIGRSVRAGRFETPVTTLDVAPTLLEAAGAPVPAEMEGVSLWGAVSQAAPLPERLLYAERRGSLPETKAVIRWPYKLVLQDGGEPQLYDLSSRRAERRDIREKKPELASVLEADLRERFELDLRGAGHETVEIDAATAEKLRALGYLD